MMFISISLLSASVADFVHCGCLLKDELPLNFYGIKCGSTLHIIKKMWPEPEIKPGMFGAELILTTILGLRREHKFGVN